MNDERIAKILDWLADRITKAEGFVIEQAPDIVQQIITMDVVVATIFIGACLIASCGLAIADVILWKASANFDEEGKGAARIIGCGLITAAIIALLSGVGYNATLIAKATYAPKAYLLQRVGVLK